MPRQSGQLTPAPSVLCFRFRGLPEYAFFRSQKKSQIWSSSRFTDRILAVVLPLDRNFPH